MIQKSVYCPIPFDGFPIGGPKRGEARGEKREESEREDPKKNPKPKNGRRQQTTQLLLHHNLS